MSRANVGLSKRPEEGKMIIFDLFGILVSVFSFTVYEQAIMAMANALRITRTRFTSLWSEDTYPPRSAGAFMSIKGNLVYICHTLESDFDEQRIRKAAQTRYEFARLALQPKKSEFLLSFAPGMT